MKHKLIMENWRRFNESTMDYSKPRGIRVTPIGLQVEKERSASLQGFSDNGKYTILQGPYWISKDYLAAIIEYNEAIFGVYSTSGYSSVGSNEFTDIKWVITGGFRPDGTRVFKLPNMQTKAFGRVNGKYPVQYKVYKEVLEDLSNKLDKNKVKESILKIYNANNIFEYLRKIGYTGKGNKITTPWETDRINFFNKQLEQYNSFRPNENGSDWAPIIKILAFGEEV